MLGLALGLVLLAIDQVAFDLVTSPCRIVPIGTIGWLCAKTERVLAIGSAIVLTTGLIGAIFGRLADGLAMGVAGALFVGLVLGLTSGDIETKTAPNQGIRQSVRNACRAGIATTLVSGLVFGLLYGVSDGPLAGLRYGLAAGPIGGLIVGLLCGGLAAVQHLVLRLLLARSHDTPWNYARFLDYAAGRLFLRKVGGGYIFIHRLLMEYFAGVER